MDATTGSSANGFDAALRALEDLETSVAQARGEQAAQPVQPAQPIQPAPSIQPAVEIAVAAEPAPAPTPAPSPAIGFSEEEDEAAIAPAAVITAVPFVEIEEGPVAEAHEPAPTPAPIAEPAAPVAAAPAPVPSAVATTPDAAPVAAPAPVAAAPEEKAATAVAQPSKRGALLGKVAIGLGLVSSVVSAAGLIIAERTIVSAQLVVANARERQAQLDSANRLIHDLQTIRDRQIELLKIQQAQAANAPVTSAELQHRMETLQAGLIEHNPMTEVVQAVRDGQSMTNARLNEFQKKMDRVEAVMNGH